MQAMATVQHACSTSKLLSFAVTVALLLVSSTGSESHSHKQGGGNTVSKDGSTSSKLPFHEHIHKDVNHTSTFNVSLDAVAMEESLYFVRRLFRNYGSADQISHTHLLELLKKIGMDMEHMKDDDSNRLVTRSVPDALHVHSGHDECSSVRKLLVDFHLDNTGSLTPQEFSYLCPAFLYQLDLDACRTDPSDHHDHVHSHCDGDMSHSHHHNHSHSHELEADMQRIDIGSIPAKVWGFSCVAVLVISLVGLLGVAVIPIMQKVFYNHMLQFLVALAIGALSGDALLHLLPHAIMAESGHKHTGPDADLEEEHQHRTSALKGLVALTGILFFFITERLLTIITAIKRNNKSEKHVKKKRCAKYCDIESNKKSVKAKLSHRQSSDDGCDRTIMLVHPNKALRGLADAAHDEFMHQCDDDAHSPVGQTRPPLSSASTQPPISLTLALGPTTQANGDNQHRSPHHHHDHTAALPAVVISQFSGDEEDGADKDVEMMEMIGGFEQIGDGAGDVMAVSSGHSHGSHHGHAHSVPNSVAAVAWMVILGDGIHNFSDGLAIGAAFASSITGGFSTSVAVFCHELPHEIGDFAVLLRAGMTAKQAILYNCLSSILCFLGMLIGVAIGNITSASEWIFALVGGMFLYIALVDMLPEMTSVDPKKGENPFLHLLLQVLGIVLGSSIMLLIALYEHDIKQAFG